MDTLSGKRFEVHLDAGLRGIPEHLVTEFLHVKIGAKVAVQPGENIQIEGGGSSCGIIVSGQQGSFGLVLTRYKVGAQQQRIAWQQLRAKIAQNLTRGLRREVADAGTDVKRQSPGVEQAIQWKRFAGVIGHLTTNGDAGNVLEDVLRSLSQGSLRDIDWLINDASLLTNCGGEQNPGLRRRPCTEFDQGKLAGRSLPLRRLSQNFVGVGREDAPFDTGQVVFRKLGDLLEEV